ncbi:hypothetical protein F183_A43450 [Bryobacterales bacterium F-183]|nr:hypothetical protein F183_A43450 [Bryobacterales bacterium F-183]
MSITAVTGTTGQSTAPQKTTPLADPLTSKNTFLQLLVAQMRNQDPLQPQDGAAYLTQLAQFSGLEQTVQLRDEVASVREAVEALTQVVQQTNVKET